MFFVFFNPTHHNYFFPKEYAKFQPYAASDADAYLNALDDTLKQQIYNRYKNRALYVDDLIKSLLAVFAHEIASNNMLIAISGDHGEEFWDQGQQGHGKTRFYNSRVQTPLLLCLPDKNVHEIELSNHSDLMPSILDYLSPRPKLDFSKYFSGHSLIRRKSEAPSALDQNATLDSGGTFLQPLNAEHDSGYFTVVTGHGFPYGNPQLAIINPDAKLWLINRKPGLSRPMQFDINLQCDLDDKKLATLPPSIDIAKAALEERLLKFIRER